MNLKILIFHVYSFNMHILLIVAPIYLKTFTCVAEICMEGRLSQNLDLGFSFCFMLCRRWNFVKKKNTKKHKSYPDFVLK